MLLKSLSTALILGGFCVSMMAAEAAPENKCKVKVLKAEKRIQEDGKGYVLALSKDKDTVNCVSTINQKRRMKYEKIAKADDITVEAVALIAAEKLK